MLKEGYGVSVYNPDLQAYHEIPITEYKKKMKSMGFDEKETKTKLEKIIRKQYTNSLKEAGFSDKDIDKKVKEIAED